MRNRLPIASLVFALVAVAHADRYVAPNAPFRGSPYKTWTTAATSIVEVLTNVPPPPYVHALTNGETIWVSNGTYSLSATVVLTTNLALRICGWQTNTAAVVINGNRGAFSNRCFYLGNGGFTLEGLTISNGWGDGAGVFMNGGLVTHCAVVNGLGQTAGGLHVNTGTVTHCTIAGNAGTNGGGVYLNGPAARVLNSTLCFNTGGQAGGAFLGQGLVSNCTLAYNSAGGAGSGGGARLEGGLLRSSTVASNLSAGGVGGVALTNALVEACEISANTGGQAGGAGLMAPAVVRSCLLSLNQNTNGSGGGAALLGGAGRSELQSCTLAANTASGGGGGFYDGSLTNLAVANTLSFLNSAPVGADIFLLQASNTDRFEQCGAEVSSHPLPPESGNRTNAPDFIDPGLNNFRLNVSSVYVDSGASQAWMTAESVAMFDMPRIMGAGLVPIVDVGAYEYPSPNIVFIPTRFEIAMLRDASTNLPLGIRQFALAADPGSLDVVCGVTVPWLTLATNAAFIPVGSVFTNPLRIDAAGLAPGAYTGAVQVMRVGGGYGYSNEFPVVLTVSGAITLNPGATSNQVMEGRSVGDNVVYMTDSGPGQVGFAISTNVPWLTVQPSGGVLNDTTPQPLLLKYRTTGLVPGSYTGRATIVYSGFGVLTQHLEAVLNVMRLDVAPLALTNVSIESVTASSQVIQVSNPGGGEFPYTATVLEGAGWLGVAPASAPLGAVALTAQYATAALAPGDYTGRVRIATAAGGGATSEVQVAFRQMARPVIEISPSVFTQTVLRGASPTNQTFTLRNASGAPRVPMAYTVTISNQVPALLGSLSSGGGVNTGQLDQITVGYADIATLEEGTYTASVVAVGVDDGTGYWPIGQTEARTSLTVRISVVGLPAPGGIDATKGAYPDKVRVTWTAVPMAASYKVYRALTFDVHAAVPADEVNTNGFDDVVADAGVVYYYWVSAINQFGGEGALSAAQVYGYRKLQPPDGLFATEGVYADRVRVTWPRADGASGYRVYRGPVGGALAPLYFTSGSTFDDYTVGSGVHYEYRVMATNSLMGSALSVKDVGFSFGQPASVTASQGEFVDRVRVQWSAVEASTEYEVWRGVRPIQPPGGGAVLAGTSRSAWFYDTGAPKGVLCYYWVRAKNAALVGGWSPWAMGFRAEAGVDLAVRQFVVLPDRIGQGAAPAVASFRLANQAGAALENLNATVRLEVFASSNAVFGLGQPVLLASLETTIPLAAGADRVVLLPRGSLRLPAGAGDYYLFVRVMPSYPSLLAETNPGDNVARRQYPVRVRAASQNYQVLNDYDGDGISDLAVYRGTAWSIRSLDGRVMGQDTRLFTGAGVPVLGDVDADRRADPILYDSAAASWQGLLSGSGYGWVGGPFGVAGAVGLVADYLGNGRAQPSVYQAGTGIWYIRQPDGQVRAYAWGAPGFLPVPGDFDGDGRWDLGVYDPATSAWYVRTVSGAVLVAGATMTGPGCVPVPGDFNGDGLWDGAVYHEASGTWFIVSPTGVILAWGVPWGAPGRLPVTGDYDGDGRSDMALYEQATGLWTIRSLDGRVITRGTQWGGPGYSAFGR